jgi:DNA helicase TIP49 (TBP-interacting protein)
MTGLRIKEVKEVYEGEVTEITPVETEVRQRVFPVHLVYNTSALGLAARTATALCCHLSQLTSPPTTAWLLGSVTH